MKDCNIFTRLTLHTSSILKEDPFITASNKVISDTIRAWSIFRKFLILSCEFVTMEEFESSKFVKKCFVKEQVLNTIYLDKFGKNYDNKLSDKFFLEIDKLFKYWLFDEAEDNQAALIIFPFPSYMIKPMRSRMNFKNKYEVKFITKSDLDYCVDCQKPQQTYILLCPVTNISSHS